MSNGKRKLGDLQTIKDSRDQWFSKKIKNTIDTYKMDLPVSALLEDDDEWVLIYETFDDFSLSVKAVVSYRHARAFQKHGVLTGCLSVEEKYWRKLKRNFQEIQKYISDEDLMCIGYEGNTSSSELMKFAQLPRCVPLAEYINDNGQYCDRETTFKNIVATLARNWTNLPCELTAIISEMSFNEQTDIKDWCFLSRKDEKDQEKTDEEDEDDEDEE